MQFNESLDSYNNLKQYLIEMGPFPGIIVDNNDPKRRDRCRIRVLDVHGTESDIPDNHLPWAKNKSDAAGKTFSVPDIGKMVYTTFPTGDLYHPVYEWAEQRDPSLAYHLSTYDQASNDAYTSFIALCYDADIQIWKDENNGLILDYAISNINIDNNADIHLQLKSPINKINLGHKEADQPVILGENFMQWMDKFIQNLMGAQGGPYFGNLLAPVIANPIFLQVCQEYFALRNTTFLSHYVNVRDNIPWKPLERIEIRSSGDDPNSLTFGEKYHNNQIDIPETDLTNLRNRISNRL